MLVDIKLVDSLQVGPNGMEDIAIVSATFGVHNHLHYLNLPVDLWVAQIYMSKMDESL